MLNGAPWDGYIKPSRIFGNLYFVGTRPASTHLIDTGDGLILIDPGYSESLYMVINNIWEIGFKPADIKYIIGTHAHYDHVDATYDLVRMTGAKTFISRADLPLLTGELFHYPIKTFKPDVLLDDGDTITLGNTSIQCVLTPGHTDGTMSFFFDVTDGDKIYRAGMFGGAGTNTLKKEFLLGNNLPFESRQKFIDSIKKLMGMRVELFLGNHVGNNKTVEKLARLGTEEVNLFVADSQNEWQAFLKERLEAIEKIIKNNE